MKWLTAVLLLVAGCAANVPTAPARPPTSRAVFEEHALHVAAEEAKARAALAEQKHMEGTFNKVVLRTRSFGKRNIDEGDGFSAGLRLSLDRPFRVSALAKSLRAASNAAAYTAKAELREAEALTCEESVEGRVRDAREELIAAYRDRLEHLLTVTRGYRQAGTLDPLTSARTELMLSRRLLEARSESTAARVHPELGKLPEAANARQDALDLDLERLFARVEREHPQVRAHLAAAEEHEHAATAERRSRIPWIDFLQVDYGTAAAGLRDLTGRVAIEVPLDDGSRGRAEREAHLGVSETYEAMSQAAAITQQALAALHELAAFEADADAQRVILEQAAGAEDLAARLIASNAEAPDRIAQLVSEAHEGRVAVLEAQERAAAAACVLRFATGVDYEGWPRVMRTVQNEGGR